MIIPIITWALSSKTGDKRLYVRCLTTNPLITWYYLTTARVSETMSVFLHLEELC